MFYTKQTIMNLPNLKMMIILIYIMSISICEAIMMNKVKLSTYYLAQLRKDALINDDKALNLYNKVSTLPDFKTKGSGKGLVSEMEKIVKKYKPTSPAGKNILKIIKLGNEIQDVI